MKLNHLISAKDLSLDQIQAIFKTARAFLPYIEKKRTLSLLQGFTIVNLFFENSTRTRISFELATKKLGGNSLNFSSSTSSTQKGETLVDTAKNIAAMQADCFVLRHSSSGSPGFLAQALGLPVVNAGDGSHEHPTQGLLDAFTIQQILGSITGKKILIIGDILHSRVARSNIEILKKLGAQISVCGPPTLIPSELKAKGINISYQLREVLSEADVVMTLRIQRERQKSMEFPSLSEYSRLWGLHPQNTSLLKKNALVLHPGPVNRGIELDSKTVDGPRSVILNQVSNGVVIRMAVLAHLCHAEGVANWLKSEESHA